MTNNSGTPIPGVTVSATGPSAVTFSTLTDANGQATSNDMGPIGTNKTYTVTVRKSGWAQNTGTVTLSQSTQGTVTIKLLNPTLQVMYGYDNTALYDLRLHVAERPEAPRRTPRTVRRARSAGQLLPAGRHVLG